jgi:hypothetical protein
LAEDLGQPFPFGEAVDESVCPYMRLPFALQEKPAMLSCSEFPDRRIMMKGEMRQAEHGDRHNEGQLGVCIMSIQSLAEAIILQSMEDLWARIERAESTCFFDGEGLHMCARALMDDCGELH